MTKERGKPSSVISVTGLPVTKVEGGVETIYANHVEVEAALFDFRMKISQIVELTEKGVTMRDLVMLYLSPQCAKSLLRALSLQVSGYEETFGKIPDSVASQEADSSGE